MLNWYAVHTKTRQEVTADYNLQRQGFDTYAPRVLLRKRQRDKWAKVVEPLFPRYLFIRVDPDQTSLAPVRSTLGVSGLVRFGYRLLPVPDSVIAYLKQLEDPLTHQHHADQWPHRPGDAVDILDGPFAGLPGVFQSVNAEDRATLLIELLGRYNSIVVPMDSVAAAR
jgi:transcriptional antiterminator RfaH